MATIINNPPSNQSSSSDGGSIVTLIVGIIIAAVLIFLFVVYGLPAMKGDRNPTQGDSIKAPTTTIQVPDKVDVNINK